MMEFNNPGLETRIIRLEETAYFQEEKLTALDKQLMAQQTQIDALARQIRQLELNFRQLRDMLADSLATDRAERPPHYQEKA